MDCIDCFNRAYMSTFIFTCPNLQFEMFLGGMRKILVGMEEEERKIPKCQSHDLPEFEGQRFCPSLETLPFRVKPNKESIVNKSKCFEATNLFIKPKLSKLYVAPNKDRKQYLLSSSSLSERGSKPPLSAI